MYGQTPTQFLNRPLADVAFDIEVFAADNQDRAAQLEKSRLRAGHGGDTPPDWDPD